MLKIFKFNLDLLYRQAWHHSYYADYQSKFFSYVPCQNTWVTMPLCMGEIGVRRVSEPMRECILLLKKNARGCLAHEFFSHVVAHHIIIAHY
jgi:hypothetical protein